MCCYEFIVNRFIQKIIKEMHQTAKPEQRQWARENILDARVFDDIKTVSLDVTSQEVKREVLFGAKSAAILTAIENAYPGYRLNIVVKEPLDLELLSSSITHLNRVG